MIKVNESELDNTFKYISKADEWYKEGVECKLEANYGFAGLFRGTISVSECHSKYYRDKYGIGTELEDGELCPWDEFDIYNSDGNKVEVV